MNQRTAVTSLFSREEIDLLTKKSDWMGAYAIGFTWSVIALTFVGLSLAWPILSGLGVWGEVGKVLVSILALIILGGRQLALGILTHDAAHGTLFKTPWLNDHLTQWLCARPVWNNLYNYRPYHLKHHAKTSTIDDPDLSLVAGLPTTQASLRRKFLRDIFGVTGLKFIVGRILMDVGIFEWTVTNEIKRLPQAGRCWWSYPLTFLKNSGATIITNGMLFGLLWLSGHPAFYLFWLLAYITPFPLFIRIRSMAEHAAMETTTDVLRNTRTTEAGFIARALVAPIRVNFHIEHHLMASVPYFRLPHMHQLLRARGYVPAPPTYFEVLRVMSSREVKPMV
ncbi:fatty acid desaturase family protein [Aquirhabdus parva]|uniref:Fatty acid desaturase n=1 Tax=Aquirhabdus parva TaxID=2283318 RepID=A0A345P9X5_9GAMM|nr:fatty acid desaturase family protein [Aquirhabdus parva]AXI04084.1 fatty acid desaturase [Aquirhabdus parva]